MDKRELVKEFESILDNAEKRTEVIFAPEDAFIQELCERIGYGAVMDSASRLWMRKDPVGAHIIAGCAGTIRHIIEKSK